MKGYVLINVTEEHKLKILSTFREVNNWKKKQNDEKVRIKVSYLFGVIPWTSSIEEVLIPDHLRWYFKVYVYDHKHYGAYSSYIGDSLQDLYNLVYLSNTIYLDTDLARQYRNITRGDYDTYK